METVMNIAKAYEMVISAHGNRPAAAGTAPAMQEPWLAAGVYRAVSWTADVVDRLARRTAARR